VESPEKKPIKYGQARQDLGGMLSIFREVRHESTFDWRDIDDHLLRAALMAVTESGHAVMFGQASGGLGVTIRIFVGKRKGMVVATTGAKFDAVMTAIINDVHMQGSDWIELTAREGDNLLAAD